MKKKTGWIVLAAVLIAALLTELFVLMPMAERRNESLQVPGTLPRQPESGQTVLPSAPQTVPVPTAPEPTAPTETTQPPESTESTKSETEPAPTAEPEPWTPPVQPQTPDVVPQPVETEPQTLSFPWTDAESGLTVEQVKSYDGAFFEDGSDAEVSGVAAIIVKNDSGKCVDYAKIQLNGLQKTFVFEATGMDAGATMVVLEAGKGAFVEQAYGSMTAEPAYSDGFERSEELIRVEEAGKKKLKVTNLTQEEIPCVRVFYKFYLQDKDVYLGGITYTARITGLAAGDSVTVKPSHYSSGRSRVIMVKTYETDQE